MTIIPSKTYKLVNSDDGIVAIITIEGVQHIHAGTRSEQTHYELHIESVIFGGKNKFDSIKHYGKPKMDVNKKYLVFLSGSGIYSLLDFQRLDCIDCSSIIEACERKLRP